MKPYFYAWWVVRGELRKLEGLSRLVMGYDGFGHQCYQKSKKKVYRP